jgi:toxin FitB
MPHRGPRSAGGTLRPPQLSVDDDIVRRWGVISGTVQRLTGRAPPVIGTLLAATAIHHDLYLATRNVADLRASGGAVFDPWTDDPAAFPLSPIR